MNEAVREELREETLSERAWTFKKGMNQILCKIGSELENYSATLALEDAMYSLAVYRDQILVVMYYGLSLQDAVRDTVSLGKRQAITTAFNAAHLPKVGQDVLRDIATLEQGEALAEDVPRYGRIAVTRSLTQRC